MRLFYVSVIIFLFAGCRKSETAMVINEPPASMEQATILSGEFRSNIHATSGKIVYSRDSSGTRRLQFNNFKTDSGPDLRVWLAKSETPSSYQELGVLKAVSGNFSYVLSPSIDPASFPYVLIWCEDFSVLFGHAQLK